VEERVFIGLGSNVGDRETHIRKAVAALGSLPRSSVVEVSSVYETEPIGFKDQSTFLNAVVEIRTALEPMDLFERLKSIERMLGRKQRERWREREIDLDILYFGTRVVQTEWLTIPHAERESRGFVLVPIVEIASDFIDPVSNLSVKTLAAQFAGNPGIKKLSTIPINYDRNTSTASR
jgi:2-amino-4-hydroxy-6-hydroxymethyldihydropteridine diphosphokinase